MHPIPPASVRPEPEPDTRCAPDPSPLAAAVARLRDPLTGLPGPVLLHDRVEHALQRRRRSRFVFALLSVGIDGFDTGTIRDAFGAPADEEMPVFLAHRLELCLRPGDTISRAEDGEFLILLDDVRSGADVEGVARRIVDAFQAPVEFASRSFHARVSVGVALLSEQHRDALHVLRSAREAMLLARSGGRGHPVVSPVGRGECAQPEAVRREAELGHAIEHDQLEIHYQPIVSLLENRIAGFEALVRWRHPERGLVGPDQFIPLAERTGLILSLGLWVLRGACRQLGEWRRSGAAGEDLMVSVNLSALQLRDPALVQHVADALGAAGLRARNLKLEITESNLLDTGEMVGDVIVRLKALGVQISVDDFGTGYSSLAYLRRFPVDYLKIDRSFVGDLGIHGEAHGIVGAVVGLAHGLGMEAVAEGVETAEQLRQIRAMDCAYAQGYFFARPLEAPAAEAMLLEAPTW